MITVTNTDSDPIPQIIACVVVALDKQEEKRNSPGSDPASVSMTTLKGPLCVSSWESLSRVTSSLCFRKAFLERKATDAASEKKKQQTKIPVINAKGEV